MGLATGLWEEYEMNTDANTIIGTAFLSLLLFDLLAAAMIAHRHRRAMKPLVTKTMKLIWLNLGILFGMTLVYFQGWPLSRLITIAIVTVLSLNGIFFLVLKLSGRGKNGQTG